MTSQNSTNNKISFFRLLQDDLRHKTWMTALSILGSFLAGPVCLLFVISNNGDSYYMEQLTDEKILFRKAQTIFSALNEGVSLTLVIAFLGALIVGWFGLRYLYNKRMSDLYHSAPVTRKKLFLVSWLSGFLIWFVPFLVFQLFDYVVGIVYIGNVSYLGTLTRLTIRNIFFVSLCFLIVYHTCLVAVMLSGNVINAIVNTLIYGLFFFAAYFLFTAFMQGFTDHFYLPSQMLLHNPVYVLSPLTTPIMMTAYLFSETPLREWIWLLVFSILLMTLNWILAFFLYQRRPSELAERGLDNRAARTLLRTAASILAGLAFSLFFYYLSDRGRMYWMAFGALFGSALAFCVLNIIYHTSFKKIFSHKLQYIGILAFTGVTIFVFTTDFFGYDRYVPKKDAITGLSIYCDALTSDEGARYELVDGHIQSRDFYAEVLEDMRFTDQDAIYNLLNRAVQNETTQYSFYIKVKVYTKFGSYYRQYHIPYTDLDYLRPFVESEEYLNEYYAGIQLQFGMPVSIDLSPVQDRQLELQDPARIRTLMEALHRDFQEHSTIEDLVRSNRMCNLYFRYISDDERMNTFSYEVPSWYENTLALLKEWYPMQVWDLRDLEFNSIHFALEEDVDSRYTTPLEYLYDYFGYTRDGLPMEAQIHQSSYPYEASSLPQAFVKEDGVVYSGTAPQDSTKEIPVHYSWDLDITSPELIQKIRPYLLIDRYRNSLREDYVLLGKIILPDETSYRCYIPYGKLPPELIQWLAGNVTEEEVEAEPEVSGPWAETQEIIQEIYD